VSLRAEQLDDFASRTERNLQRVLDNLPDESAEAPAGDEPQVDGLEAVTPGLEADGPAEPAAAEPGADLGAGTPPTAAPAGGAEPGEVSAKEFEDLVGQLK